MKIKEIKDFFSVKKEDDLNVVIETLNKSPYKILFVLEGNKIIGTITDGDIRRYLFNKKNNISEIKAFNIMNTNFKYIYEKEYKSFSIKDYLRYNVEYLPVVNEKMEIIKIINIPINFQELTNLKTKVLIMAGGKGTRLYPLTRVIPKPLVPYKDKTIIEQIMEQFINSGFDEFILSVNYKKDLIKNYFSDLKYNIEYIEEKDFLGTAGSIAYLKFHNITKPFFIANCDVLLDVDFKEVLEYHKSEKADITIISAKETVDIAYGVLEFDENNNFKEISEKPNYEFYVNTGIYVLNPNIIDLISLNEKIDMPELLERALKNNKKIKVYKSDKKMIDIGQWDYYKKFL
ncbi:sugar phosphate nucleotidyltransferase [Marinitoga aeolica]|uniref:NTP transferase domain-containing protein n=1 Tax=Marinitoga aeolica TaxID=2809031 RepID=A0ABY8PTT1_9BACT|nr:sugar phosphate nucleotidyltransferase [Marinitoga aeolica]WGS66036.1 NTP transferase domain-containing protein [Marinitoga aeolica]